MHVVVVVVGRGRGDTRVALTLGGEPQTGPTGGDDDEDGEQETDDRQAGQHAGTVGAGKPLGRRIGAGRANEPIGPATPPHTAIGAPRPG